VLRARHSRVALLALVALFVVAVDQLTKQWALSTLVEGERTDLLGDLLGLELIFNPGAALSFASGSTWIFTLAAVGVTVVIVRVARRLGSTTWAFGLGLLLGGAIGNLIDRLLRPPSVGSGHVVDFLAYGRLFIGNVADIAIVAAAVLIVLLSLRGITVEGTRVLASEPAGMASVADGDDVDSAPAESAVTEADARSATVSEPGPGESAASADAPSSTTDAR